MQLSESALVQIMAWHLTAWHLLGAKPLPEAMLTKMPCGVNRSHELTDIISHFYFQKHRCDFLWHCKSGVTCVKVNVSVKNSVNALDEAGCRFMCQRVVWGGVAYVSGNCSYGCYGWVCLETVTDCWRLLCGGSSVNRASESKKNLCGWKCKEK